MKSFPALAGFLVMFACAGLMMYWLLTASGKDKAAAPDRENRLPRSEKEFRDQLTVLRMKKEKLERSIQRVENQKQETVEFLRGKGVESTADLRGNPDLEYAARNLKGWSEQLNALQADVGKYDRAIAAIVTMLDEFDRRRINDSVAISEEEWIRMQSVVKDLDETLGMDPDDILKDEEMNELLREELKDGQTAEPAGSSRGG